MVWRGPEDRIPGTCEELGIGFVSWNPLGVGPLTGAIDVQTRFAPGDFRSLTERFAPDNLAANVALADLVLTWADRKEAQPAQIALAWLMAQEPWIVPNPGPPQTCQLLLNIGATEVQGTRLPEAVQVISGVEAPQKI